MAGEAADTGLAVGIGRAAWKLEDAFQGERTAREYPKEQEARDVYVQYAWAETQFRKALFAFVALSIFETPNWCNTTENVFLPGEMWDPNERCGLENVPKEHILLSTVPYLPPGTGLILEAALIYIVVRKLLLERKLQTQYFAPVEKDSKDIYIDMNMVNFGLAMVALEVADMCCFAVFRPNWRVAFIARTGYLCLLPSMTSLFVCLKHVIVEFLSIASFLFGTMAFFSWICATVFKGLDTKVHGEPVNKGFETFGASFYTIFVAGATDEFVDCFLRSYTAYRIFGLLWLMYLVVVQVLLLSLVLDTLVAAYTTYREHLEESSIEHDVEQIMQTFDMLVEATGESESKLSKESFIKFVREFGRSPRVRRIDDKTAEIMFSAVDRSGDGSISKPEFCSICGVMHYDLWTTEKYSWLKTKPIWESGAMRWFVGLLERGSFDNVMNVVLLFNLLLVIFETYCDLENLETPLIIGHIELIFSLVYVVEVGLRLCVYSWPEYWSFRSNQFDFFTTWALLGSSIVETVADCDDSTPDGCSTNIKRYMNILRLLRLLRVVKQLKQLKVVQFMVNTIMKLVLASRDVLVPLGVVLYFFTMLSVQLWGGLLHQSHQNLKETEYAESTYFVLNYNDFLMAFGVWVIALLCEYVPKFAESVYMTSSYPSTWIVHFIFYAVGVSIVFELVKAFTIEVFVELTKRKDEKHETGEDEEEEEEEEALKALAADFEKKGERLHFRNTGDVMMQEKMREAFDEIKERTEGEAKDHGHGHH